VQEALALQSLTGNRVGEALMSLGYITAHSCSGRCRWRSARQPIALDKASAGEVLLASSTSR